MVAGANPVYWMPDLFRKTPFVVALASFPDETTETAHVVLPIHTPLESWGDYEPWTGIHCLQQPAMRPVFDTRDLGDVLLAPGQLQARNQLPGVPPQPLARAARISRPHSSAAATGATCPRCG